MVCVCLNALRASVAVAAANHSFNPKTRRYQHITLFQRTNEQMCEKQKIRTDIDKHISTIKQEISVKIDCDLHYGIGNSQFL